MRRSSVRTGSSAPKIYSEDACCVPRLDSKTNLAGLATFPPLTIQEITKPYLPRHSCASWQGVRNLTANSAQIRKAVIPAAGLGTRLRPLTSITAKEMLPLGPKPAVQYIIEELHSAGISDIIFVVSSQKPGIRNYFGDSTCDGQVRVSYVLQDVQKGLAHAILQAEDAVGGEPFIVALGDTIITSRQQTSPISRLIDAYSCNPAFASITVEKVPMEDVYRYGMVKPVAQVSTEAFEIDGLIEKPKIEESPSDYAIGGRYIFASEIFDYIRKTPPGALGEIQITDAARLAIADGGRVWCSPVLHGERRYDIGNFKTYCEAFAAVCMLDAELSQSIVSAAKDSNI